jgi:lycopene beta-cyclase
MLCGSHEDASMRTIRTVGIRGAGLSGLSMARALIKARPELSISVYDLRPRLPHPQRTFCFFKPRAINLDYLPRYEWPSIAFRSSTFSRTLDVSSSPYTLIRGDDFFDYTLRDLEHSGVIFNWDCQKVLIGPDWIETEVIKTRFDLVIDAAFCSSGAKSSMWQSFAGMWVETEQPVFDPTVATLMDLKESSVEAPVSFIYVLPTTPHSALIEHTTFSPAPLPEQHHLERCRDWLDSQTQSNFQIKNSEHGIIPMGLIIDKQRENKLIVGSNAGAVRPATGYAFAATLRHTTELARSILDGKAASRYPHPRLIQYGDKLFLRALRRDPLNGGYILGRLLERSPEKSLIAFLSGEPSWSEAISVWCSAPKLTMLRSLIRI